MIYILYDARLWSYIFQRAIMIAIEDEEIL